MKIALLNVRYSPNLGDGVLSECLEAELRRHHPAADFVTVDVAGRQDYGAGSRWRRPVMGLLMLAPAALRRIAARFALGRLMKRLAPQFARAMAGCDAAVLGGGNLLADADLNFPMKIAGAVDAAGKDKPNGMPFAVFAVGVSHNWSAEGSALFRGVLASPSLISVSVRDQLSHDALLAQAPEVADRKLMIVRDPGLLASRCYPAGARDLAAPIGLCITDPLLLRYHGGTASSKDLQVWFGDLARDLAESGHRVLLFTNGSPEDRAFLARNAAQWRGAHADEIAVAEPANTPAELVRLIAGCSAVIAHRMHACIVAHSFGIPTVGLQWDPKLDAFMQLASRGGYMHVAGSDRAAVVGQSIRRALADGVEPAAHQALLAAAASDVAVLAASLKDAARG